MSEIASAKSAVSQGELNGVLDMFLFVFLKVTSLISVELPESEEPKNEVRVGWSSDSASLQLGKFVV